MGLKTSKIIAIYPLEDQINVTWMLGSFCNYACQYCPSELHDSTSRPHDLHTMKTAWQNFYDKTSHIKGNYKIMFTGGEVTANKNFLPLVDWLRQTFERIEWAGFITNGSASVRYYEQLAPLLEAIAFSTHSEFMDENAFFAKIERIHKLMTRPKKSVHVNVMQEHWNEPRIPLYAKWLQARGISYSINRVYHDVGTRQDIRREGKTNLRLTDIEQQIDIVPELNIGHNATAILDDGSKVPVYGAQINNDDLNRFQGWHCQAGTRRFYIDKTLQIFSGECCHDDLGNALTDFNALVDGTICSRATCSPCVDDIITAKQQPTRGAC